MITPLEDGIEITNETGSRRARLRASHRPWSDEILDFSVELQDDGLVAATGVRTIEGDGLAGWLADIAESFRGWQETRSWESLECDARIHASHDGRGHVTLRFAIRGPHAYRPDAWESAVSITLDAGEDMRTFAREIESFLS